MAWHSLAGMSEIRWICDAPEIECFEVYSKLQVWRGGRCPPGYYLYDGDHVSHLVSANHSALRDYLRYYNDEYGDCSNYK